MEDNAMAEVFLAVYLLMTTVISMLQFPDLQDGTPRRRLRARVILAMAGPVGWCILFCVGVAELMRDS
jgi:hypothetical protein